MILYIHVSWPILQTTLNSFMGLGRAAWQEARSTLQRLLSAQEPLLCNNKDLRARYLFFYIFFCFNWVNAFYLERDLSISTTYKKKFSTMT